MKTDEIIQPSVPGTCPICGVKIPEKGLKQCQICGWVYDNERQNDEPGRFPNCLSQKQYREMFSSFGKAHPGCCYHDDPDLLYEFKLSYMRKNGIPHPMDGYRYEKPCPVCGEYVIHFDYDICPICGWELDPVQMDDPDFWGGANNLSLNDFKNLFLELRKENRSYRWEDDPSIREKREKEIFAKYSQSEDDVSNNG